MLAIETHCHISHASDRSRATQPIAAVQIRNCRSCSISKFLGSNLLQMTLFSGLADLVKPAVQSSAAVAKPATLEVKTVAKTAPTVSTKTAVAGLAVGGAVVATAAAGGPGGLLQQAQQGLQSLGAVAGSALGVGVQALSGGLICAGSTFLAWEISHNVPLTVGVAACTGLIGLRISQPPAQQ